MQSILSACSYQIYQLSVDNVFHQNRSFMERPASIAQGKPETKRFIARLGKLVIKKRSIGLLKDKNKKNMSNNNKVNTPACTEMDHSAWCKDYNPK